jgi:hypothetical protein
MSIWEQLISESAKKDYHKIYGALENITYDILVFLRCELIARIFLHMRDMTVKIKY